MVQNSDCQSISPLVYVIKHLAAKRAFDILFSLLCLTIGFPLYLLIAVLIFITSDGSIIYSQIRVGRGGKLFRCYKFRTMYLDAEQRLQSILQNDPVLQREWSLYHKLKNDPRVTFFGKILRKTSLDELPQFWNVFKGDLSVVGPRPVVQQELNTHFGDKAYKILCMRPGLTGLWQVSGRSDINCYQTRIKLDEYYIDNHSLQFDLKLIAKTIPVIFLSRGAY